MAQDSQPHSLDGGDGEILPGAPEWRRESSKARKLKNGYFPMKANSLDARPLRIFLAVLALFVAGLLSGMLTAWTKNAPGSFYHGSIFGVAIWICLWIFWGRPPFWKFRS